MPDLGLTHIALAVSDLDRSIAFYEKYARMVVVHRREGVAWISDRTRPFAIVLAQTTDVGGRLAPFSHLGVACGSRVEVDDACAEAKRDGCWREGPNGGDGPAGYWMFLSDPDGHTLELTYGQEVNRAIAAAGFSREAALPGESPVREESGGAGG